MPDELIQIESKPISLDEAFTYCEKVASAHYENFPITSLFLPEEKRPYIQAIYAFSRTADDFADESDRPAEEKLERLNDWEDKLKRCYESSVDHPVFVALKETIKRYDIPIEPLNDLITAFKRDVTQNRYQTFEDLLTYCACSANPVGRLVLIVFGYTDHDLFKLSDHICTALQLTNFWQDVAIDLKKDRLYIPLEDMEANGYELEEWNNGIVNAAFKSLMRFEVERTREMFYAGAELPSLVERGLQLELKLIWFGGMAILKKLQKTGYDIYHRRPTIQGFDKLMILQRGLIYNDLSRYGRKRKQWDLT